MSIYVSASALSDFISCQTKTYYRIFVPQEGIPSKEQLIGTVTHKIIETAWNDKDKARLLVDELSKKESLDNLSKSYISNYIETFFDKFRAHLSDNDLVEHRFKLKLWNDVYLVGVMDRVSNGIVFDWKTGSNIPKKLDNNVQFILYNLAYNMMYKSSPSGLYFASLRTGDLVRFSENKMLSKELVGNVIPQFVDAVRNKKFMKNGLFNGGCYRCPYKLDCLKGDEYELDSSEFIKE